jgi:hypothetical protein
MAAPEMGASRGAHWKGELMECTGACGVKLGHNLCLVGASPLPLRAGTACW